MSNGQLTIDNRQWDLGK